MNARNFMWFGLGFGLAGVLAGVGVVLTTVL